MACVTADDVKEIINGCTLTTDQIDPFINAAHQYLDTVFATDLTVTLTTTARREVERWFVAHLLVSVGYQTIQTVKRERLGDAEIEYSVSDMTGQGLSSTPYGRNALLFDTTGLLAKAGKMKASIYAVKSFD